jgi:hypothetical protein
MEHVRLSSDVDRVLHIGLSEEDWKAFLAVAPQPVTWLREKIREAIEGRDGAESQRSKLES